MSIKSRLFLSYIGMIVIPVILIILIAKNNVNDVDPIRVSELLEIKNAEISRKINLVELNNEDKLGDIEFIRALDTGLDNLYASMVWRKDGQILYSGIMDQELLAPLLPDFNAEFNEESYFKSKFKSDYLIYLQKDYYLSDLSENSLFLVLNAKLLERDITIARVLFVIIIISILVLTTRLLTFSVYRDIIKSIQKLKQASNEIKNGNLDYLVKPHLKDEIGDLSLAFEEMRVRLKDSLKMQEKYEENRRTLISNISHDLKTPIMSIKGYIGGIRDGIADSPEKMNKYIDTIYKKSCDLETMINELFLFSKLDLKEVSFNFQPIDIIKYLKYCVEDTTLDLEKKGGKIELHHQEQAITVLVDAEKLQRVIMNIVGNSIKYMGEKPLRIGIFVENKAETVLIEIKDNGLGISQEDLPFIFERFYRTDKSRNTSIGGSGIGLAIAKQIIEKHGGEIWADSETNKGTSIFFVLRKYEGGSDKLGKNIDN
ncbi:sensor histidine kinase [Desulforamulus aquiferis]|uniref:histidine kinase n=1 Tax=Desulforamulus aquiferis TaxID=1397668 RepID=A0AAW7Z9C0_9FIRM|nr:ATP-binding protein [Desulforamulus aquiferis]MDO7785921.1 ATP-binding protein [Desulforamulus aquiferis]